MVIRYHPQRTRPRKLCNRRWQARQTAGKKMAFPDLLEIVRDCFVTTKAKADEVKAEVVDGKPYRIRLRQT
jgi:hypothetical protein